MNNTLISYVLRLADDSLILAQRLSEWCYNAPYLEEDIALTNIALDYLGRANSYYEYASTLDINKRTSDDFAFKRNPEEFMNCLLVEQPNGHFGDTIARQFLIDSFYKVHLSLLQKSKDEQLRAIAQKSIKETDYHLRHSSQWVIRLGDGTKESHKKIQQSFIDIWKYTKELFTMDDIEYALLDRDVGVNLKEVEQQWKLIVEEIFEKAMLKIPSVSEMKKGGRQGKHSGCFNDFLNNMQYLQRTYPNAKW